jgi:tetratricopeptide (TPR) repeat protein
VTTSIVNILEVFRLFRRFASRCAPPATPRERALASLRRRDFAGAERELTALIDADAEPAGALSSHERAFLLNKRGVARAAMQQPQSARDDFAAALACVAGYAPALTNLGNLMFEEGDLDAAIALYEAAILADAKYVNAHLNLGIAHKRAGRLEEGVRWLRRAQQLEATSLRRRRPP